MIFMLAQMTYLPIFFRSPLLKSGEIPACFIPLFTYPLSFLPCNMASRSHVHLSQMSTVMVNRALSAEKLLMRHARRKQCAKKENRLHAQSRTSEGVFSLNDAREAGFSGRTIQDRYQQMHFHRPFRGVYAPAGIPLQDRALCHAAVKRTAPDAALSKTSALWWYGIVNKPPTYTDCLLPHARRIRRIRGIRVSRTRTFTKKDITVYNGIRITTPERTFVDTAHLISGNIEMLIDKAIRENLTTIPKLITTAIRLLHPKRPGARILLSVISKLPDVLHKTRSPMETFFASYLTKRNLPSPDLNVPIKTDTGIYECDSHFTSTSTVIEVDSKYHDGPFQKARDQRKDAALERSGKQVLRVRYKDLKGYSPRKFLRELQSALSPSKPKNKEETT